MDIKLTNKERIVLTGPDDVYRVMKNILLREQKIDRDKEHFWMIGLSAAGRIEYIELVSLGSSRALNVEPMNVFRFAVMKNAAAVVMVHNHPSGNLKPSASDKDVTDRLIQVGRILAIEVLDHLIISEKSYLSFESIGLFDELKGSLKYVPTFEIVERIREEEKRIREEAVILAVLEEKKKGKVEVEKAKAALERERKLKEKALEKERKEKEKAVASAEKKKAVEMARQMKKDKKPIEEIIKYTGLTRKDISKMK